MIALIGLVVILCAGLLALGFLAPRLSRRVQGHLDHGAERVESSAESKPRPVRGPGERAVEASQHAADRTTEAGRRGRDEAERAGR